MANAVKLSNNKIQNKSYFKKIRGVGLHNLENIA
jgi:hypothetical protein